MKQMFWTGAEAVVELPDGVSVGELPDGTEDNPATVQSDEGQNLMDKLTDITFFFFSKVMVWNKAMSVIDYLSTWLIPTLSIKRE